MPKHYDDIGGMLTDYPNPTVKLHSKPLTAVRLTEDAVIGDPEKDGYQAHAGDYLVLFPTDHPMRVSWCLMYKKYIEDTYNLEDVEDAQRRAHQ